MVRNMANILLAEPVIRLLDAISLLTILSAILSLKVVILVNTTIREYKLHRPPTSGGSSA